MLTREALCATGVIAIVRGIGRDKLDDTLAALLEGGVRHIEVTANTPGAEDMVAHIADNWTQRGVVVGAGTVLDAERARRFIERGARFLLSPSLDRGMVDTALENDVMPIPGAWTPTEIVTAWQWGAPIVKLFPAVTGGVGYIRQLRGPLPQIPLMAVGGVDRENAGDWIRAGCVAVGVGSQLVSAQLVNEGRWTELRDRAAAIVDAVEKAR